MVSSGLVDRVDVSHFRLSVHLLIAFIILSLIFWNYLKIKVNTITIIQLGLVSSFNFFIISIYTNINRCICFWYGCW